MRIINFFIKPAMLLCLVMIGGLVVGCSETPTAGPNANQQNEDAGTTDPGLAPGDQSEPGTEPDLGTETPIDGGPILLPPTSAPE